MRAMEYKEQETSRAMRQMAAQYEILKLEQARTKDYCDGVVKRNEELERMCVEHDTALVISKSRNEELQKRFAALTSEYEAEHKESQRLSLAIHSSVEALGEPLE